MNVQELGAGAVGANRTLRTGLALTGLAALTMPAGAEIFSITGLEKVVEPGESYYLSGIPQLEIGAQTYGTANLPDKSVTYHDRILFTNHYTYDPNNSKTLVSGSWVGMSALGEVIGPAGPAGPYSYSYVPEYAVLQDAYLGIRFMEGGHNHYGWLNVSVDKQVIIHGFGYNDVADATIRAGQISAVPEPSTLTFFAMGGIAIAGMRRRRRAAS